MSVLSQFSGGTGPVASVGSAPFAIYYGNSVAQTLGITELASGAMTAAAWKTALSVAGRGRLHWCAMYLLTDLARTLGMRVTIDGAVIADHSRAITTAGSNTYQGLGSIGGAVTLGTGNTMAILQPVDYRSSLLIEIKNSVSETNSLNVAAKYEVWT